MCWNWSLGNLLSPLGTPASSGKERLKSALTIFPPPPFPATLSGPPPSTRAWWHFPVACLSFVKDDKSLWICASCELWVTHSSSLLFRWQMLLDSCSPDKYCVLAAMLWYSQTIILCEFCFLLLHHHHRQHHSNHSYFGKGIHKRKRASNNYSHPLCTIAHFSIIIFCSGTLRLHPCWN